MSKNIVINKTNENEITINESKIGLVNDNIIYIIAVGFVDEELAKVGERIVCEFLEKTNKNTNILVNLTNAGQPSSKAIRIYLRVSEMAAIKKIAMFGISAVAKVLGSFMIRLSKKKNFQFFKTKEEALAWLNSNF